MRLIDADALKRLSKFWCPGTGAWPLSDLHALIDGQPTCGLPTVTHPLRLEGMGKRLGGMHQVMTQTAVAAGCLEDDLEAWLREETPDNEPPINDDIVRCLASLLIMLHLLCDALPDKCALETEMEKTVSRLNDWLDEDGR